MFLWIQSQADFLFGFTVLSSILREFYLKKILVEIIFDETHMKEICRSRNFIEILSLDFDCFGAGKIK